MARFLETWDGQYVRLAETRKDAAVVVREVKIGPADVSTTPAGAVTIAFSTLNEIDSDMDVTVPGAFAPSEVVLSQWGHATWQPGFLPIGRGRIKEEGNRAIFRGQMFLKMQAASETFEALRGLGPLAEFSYGYNVAEADRGSFQGQYVRFLRKLIVHEVSPVLKGAGVRTGLVEMSSLDPMQAAVQAAELANTRALAELAGHKRSTRQVVGYHPLTGAPVYLSGSGTGGRK